MALFSAKSKPTLTELLAPAPNVVVGFNEPEPLVITRTMEIHLSRRAAVFLVAGSVVARVDPLPLALGALAALTSWGAELESNLVVEDGEPGARLFLLEGLSAIPAQRPPAGAVFIAGAAFTRSSRESITAALTTALGGDAPSRSITLSRRLAPQEWIGEVAAIAESIVGGDHSVLRTIAPVFAVGRPVQMLGFDPRGIGGWNGF